MLTKADGRSGCDSVVAASPAVPVSPPGQDVDQRIQRVRRAFNRFGPLVWLWLIWMVWPDHPWDDKVLSRRYADFGNFAFGAVCCAAHIPLQPALRAAGAVEEYLTDWFPENGHWWGRPPYGDNPDAHQCIKDGYQYARATLAGAR